MKPAKKPKPPTPLLGALRLIHLSLNDAGFFLTVKVPTTHKHFVKWRDARKLMNELRGIVDEMLEAEGGE